MAMNRVQFQPGLSIHSFIELYGTEEQCEQALIGWRWPSGYVCGSCQGKSHSSFRRGTLLYYQCCDCRFQCSLISGTVFEATKLALTKWFLGVHLLTQAKTNLSMLEFSRHVGVSYPTAWLMKHKIMELMRKREDARQLTGRVEIDDAYLGGARSGGKVGRGSENKIPFVVAVQTTESGAAQFVCLAQLPFTNAALKAFGAKSLIRPLTVVSDGLACFKTLKDAGLHDRTVTGGGQESVKLEKFRAVNTLLGNLKTSIAGTYHSVKFAKYTHRYLAEFQYKFNRRFDMSTILERLLRAAVASDSTTRRRIRGAEVGC